MQRVGPDAASQTSELSRRNDFHREQALFCNNADLRAVFLFAATTAAQCTAQPSRIQVCAGKAVGVFDRVHHSGVAQKHALHELIYKLVAKVAV